MSAAIEIQSLTKVFFRRRSLREFIKRRRTPITAVNGLSVHIGEGEIFGLLGPNGSGKTTTIKMLSTLILPTSGTAIMYGHDIVRNAWQVKGLIGLIHSDERSFFWRLTGRQNLDFFASLFRISKPQAKKRIDELLHLTNMERRADEPFHSYSTGMKQKLAIARGLLIKPKVLFMDEALRSVDPVSTRKIRNFIRNDVKKVVGGTVILATNRIDEAAEVCDRIAILNRGALVACGSKDELVSLVQNSVQYDLEVKNIGETIVKDICRLSTVRDCEKKFQVDGKFCITVTLQTEEGGLHQVLQEIMKKNGVILKCTRLESSLEMVFHKVVETSGAHKSGA